VGTRGYGESLRRRHQPVPRGRFGAAANSTLRGATIAGMISAAPIPSGPTPDNEHWRLCATAVLKEPHPPPPPPPAPQPPPPRNDTADREGALAAEILADLAAGDHQRASTRV